MAKKAKRVSSLDALNDDDRSPRRSVESFALSTIPPRSFMAGQYFRLARPVSFGLPKGKLVPTQFGFDEIAIYDSFPKGTPVEYDHDVRRATMHGSVNYHKCHVDKDDVRYWLYLTDDQLDVFTQL